MKKTNIHNWLVWLFLVGLTLFLTTCGDKNPASGDEITPEVTNTIGPAGGQVVSDDGLLSLTIPEGALQDEQIIKLKKISDNGLEDLFGVSPEFTYELLPDGLTFQVPVQFEIAIATDIVQESDKQLFEDFVAFSISESKVEMVSEQNIDYSLSKNSVTLIGSITHFSSITVLKKSVLEIELEYPNEICLGETSEMVLTVINKYEPLLPLSNNIPAEIFLYNTSEYIEFSEVLDGKDKISIVIPVYCESGRENVEYKISFSMHFIDHFEEDKPNGVLSVLNFVFETPSIKCIDCRLPAPNLVSPENGATNISTSPTVSWEEVLGADWYQVQWVEEDGTFDDEENVPTAITQDSEQLTIKSLKEGTTYQWRVRAVRGDYEGNSSDYEFGHWSEVWSFTTAGGASLGFGSRTECFTTYEGDWYFVVGWSVDLSGIHSDEYGNVFVYLNVELPESGESEVVKSTGSDSQVSYPLYSPTLLYMAHIIKGTGEYKFDVDKVVYNGDEIDFSGETTSGVLLVTEDDLKGEGDC